MRLAIIDILRFHGFEVHDNEPGGPAEAGIYLIVETGTFTRYGNFAHAVLPTHWLGFIGYRAFESCFRLTSRSPSNDCETASSNHVAAAMDPEGQPLDHGLGYDPSRLSQDAAERMAGDPHVPGRFLLVHALQIRQAERLMALIGQGHLIKLPHGDPLRLEIGHPWGACDKTAFAGPGHVFLHLCSFEQNITPAIPRVNSFLLK